MLRRGVYRTKEAGLVTERHGGAEIEHRIYWYLCFYLPTKDVGLYGSSSTDYLQPYRKNQIELKGQISSMDDQNISFSIFNKDVGNNIIFSGTIKRDQLRLTYYHQNKPEQIFEDDFEFIGTGEGETDSQKGT